MLPAAGACAAERSDWRRCAVCQWRGRRGRGVRGHGRCKSRSSLSPSPSSFLRWQWRWRWVGGFYPRWQGARICEDTQPAARCPPAVSLSLGSMQGGAGGPGCRCRGMGGRPAFSTAGLCMGQPPPAHSRPVTPPQAPRPCHPFEGELARGNMWGPACSPPGLSVPSLQ